MRGRKSDGQGASRIFGSTLTHHAPTAPTMHPPFTQSPLHNQPPTPPPPLADQRPKFRGCSLPIATAPQSLTDINDYLACSCSGEDSTMSLVGYATLLPSSRQSRTQAWRRQGSPSGLACRTSQSPWLRRPWVAECVECIECINQPV